VAEAVPVATCQSSGGACGRCCPCGRWAVSADQTGRSGSDSKGPLLLQGVSKGPSLSSGHGQEQRSLALTAVRSAGAKVPCSRRRRIGRAGRCLPTGDGRCKTDDPSVEMSSKDRSISTTGGCEADASERPRGEAGEGAEYGWDGFECPTWTTFRWERGFCVGPHSRLPSSIACADARAISPHSARPRTAFPPAEIVCAM